MRKNSGLYGTKSGRHTGGGRVELNRSSSRTTDDTKRAAEIVRDTIPIQLWPIT